MTTEANPPFLPRAGRLNLSFPVEFRQQSESISGTCLNISESGLLARFRSELPVWVKGELWADAGVTLLLVDVRVVRALETLAGLTFRFRSESEREQVRSIVRFAAAHTRIAGHEPPF